MKKVFILFALLIFVLGVEAYEVVDVEIDYTTVTSYSWNGGWRSTSASERVSVVPGKGIYFHSEEAVDPFYDVQFQLPGIKQGALDSDASYTITIKIKGNVEQIIRGYFSGSDKPGDIPVTGEEQTLTFTGCMDNPTAQYFASTGAVLIQCGDYVGDWTISYIKITHEERANINPEPTPVNPTIGSTFYQGGIYYKIGENNTFSVTSGEVKYSGDVVIPEQVTYNGKAYNVTSIGESAFYGCSGLTSVTIPNSVMSIGREAFYDCSSLTSITIPNGCSIGQEAFEACSGLTSITLSGRMSCDIMAFYGCDNLDAVQILDLEAFLHSTFDLDEGPGANPLLYAHHLYLNGEEIKDLVIPNTITEINRYVFMGCSGLTSVTIPNSVTSINYDAFWGCTGLTSITIPNSVTSIGSSAFNGCSGLTSIKVEGGNLKYDSRNNCNAIIETTSNTLIIGCKNSTIPNSVTSIGSSAFSGCSGLASITIPNSVTSIGYSAFADCSGLTSLTIGNSVTSIGDRAFLYCSGLTSVTIPNSVTSIGGYAFYNCSGLTSITIPNSVISIGGYAFNGTAWLNNQPDGLVYAGKVAYKYKGEMPANTQIRIKDETKGISWGAFSGCCSLTSVTIPSSVTSIDSEVFWGCSGLTTITSEIEKPFEIYSSTFDSDTYNVAELIVPKGTKTQYQATEGWNKFAKITEAEEESDEFEVDGIYYRKLVNNTASVIKGSNEYFGDVVIPSQVKYKGHTYSVTIIERAFEGCANLTSVTIPNRVILIYHYAFEGCDNLKSVYISDLEAWCNVKFEEGFVEPLSSNPLRQAHHLFLNGIEVKDLAIPQNMAEIKYATFQGCSGLTSVLFPEGVTSIGSCAFYDCKGLTSLLLPNSVTSIGWHAFSGCSGLTSVTIPNSVTSIGFYAFSDCTGLTTITSEIQQPFKIDESVFSSVTYSLTELIVPKGTKALYQATEGWNKFAKITEAGDKDEVLFTIDGVTYQGSKPEKNVTVKSVDASKTSIEIPASVSYDGITYQVTGITDGVFDGSNMAALIWDVEAALPNNAFGNASIGSNFLLYVKSSSYAPSSVKNVIVDGIAQTIVLSDDGGQFYCPQAFTARRISYSHNYSMETGKGSTMGWESIALPFDVQRIIHSTQGEIVPFAAYSSGTNQKPFWLAYMSASGFKRTADIRANEAYIIAMPNNSSYQDNYILAGDVTFSAENITVPKTPTFNGTFLPAFSFIAKSSSVYALNVNNRYVRYSGSEKPGSIFIRDLRDVRPFEAYISNSSTRGVIEIAFDDDTTSIDEELRMKNEESAGAVGDEIVIYTLSAQQVARTTQRDLDVVWQQLPKGVYIVNGKKMIK